MKEPKAWLKQRLGTILLATDLYQNSKLALGYAVNLAHLFGSAVKSLHVFEYGPWGHSVESIDHVPSTERVKALQSLDKFLLEAGHPDVASEVVVDESFVTTAIIKFLHQRNIDLLVIGTEGIHEGIDHLVLGSNTEALMLGSRKLILTVGPQVPEVPERELHYKKVVCISDFSIASTAAAAYAFAFGQALGVETEQYQLASKFAKGDTEKLKRTAAQYCDSLRYVDPELPASWYEVDGQISKIIPEEQLLTLASESSNLLVLGVQPASFLQRHLHTSLAYRLLTEARSPVLTVPASFGPIGG